MVSNVLLVVVDQLAADVLGCYGGPVPTPNVDQLAEEGARFTDTTCPTPLCSPSRASLATGQYPHGHSIVHNVMRRDYPMTKSQPTEEGLQANDETTAKLLAEVGYTTHHYGKFHLLDEELPYFPDMFTEHNEYAKGMANRFREIRTRPRADWMDWYGWALPVSVDERYREVVASVREELEAASRNHEFLTKIGCLELDPEETFDWQVADRATDRIQTADEPFFVTASFNWPHDPNVAPEPYYSQFDPDTLDLPENYGVFEERFAGDWSRDYVSIVGEWGVREFLRVYYAMVAFIDEQVGYLLDALDKRDVTDDTLVVFTADHGDMTGGHGMVWKSTDAFYDEIIRVPLIIRGPGVVADDRECKASLVDLLPTILELTGHGDRVPDDIHGRSLAAVLRGENEGPQYSFAERIEPDPLGTRSCRPGDDDFMVRSDGWKYVRYADGDEYLYDLEDDPGETEDRSEDPACADQRADLAAQLNAWLDRTSYD